MEKLCGLGRVTLRALPPSNDRGQTVFPEDFCCRLRLWNDVLPAFACEAPFLKDRSQAYPHAIFVQEVFH